MAAATTTNRRPRAESVAEAQRLRAEGLLLREIGERMGAPISTVQAWINDPDLSKHRARRASYRGRCEECGGHTDGSNGRAAAPTLCASCREWLPGQIIDAIRAWVAANGSTPREGEWETADRTHPSHSPVARVFGTWNAALRAAGFDPVCDKHRFDDFDSILARLRAGEPTSEVARDLGCSANCLTAALRYRGLSITAIRAEAAA